MDLGKGLALAGSFLGETKLPHTQAKFEVSIPISNRDAASKHSSYTLRYSNVIAFTRVAIERTKFLRRWQRDMQKKWRWVGGLVEATCCELAPTCRK